MAGLYRIVIIFQLTCDHPQKLQRDIETMTSKTIINYKGRGLRRWYLAYSLVGSQLEKIQDGRNIWAGIVVPSLSCQRQFRAAAILPPLISGSNQNDSRDFVRRFGPLGVHQLRVMQLRLNANELTLDRKWLYAPLAANSKAITIPFFPPPPLSIFHPPPFENPFPLATQIFPSSSFACHYSYSERYLFSFVSYVEIKYFSKKVFFASEKMVECRNRILRWE